VDEELFLLFTDDEEECVAWVVAEERLEWLVRV
jgi:hypothetical protein